MKKMLKNIVKLCLCSLSYLFCPELVISMISGNTSTTVTVPDTMYGQIAGMNNGEIIPASLRNEIVRLCESPINAFNSEFVVNHSQNGLNLSLVHQSPLSLKRSCSNLIEVWRHNKLEFRIMTEGQIAEELPHSIEHLEDYHIRTSNDCSALIRYFHFQHNTYIFEVRLPETHGPQSNANELIQSMYDFKKCCAKPFNSPIQFPMPEDLDPNALESLKYILNIVRLLNEPEGKSFLDLFGINPEVMSYDIQLDSTNFKSLLKFIPAISASDYCLDNSCYIYSFCITGPVYKGIWREIWIKPDGTRFLPNIQATSSTNS